MLRTLIDVAALKPLVGTPGIVIVDCRFDLNAPEAGRRAFLERHVATAQFADLNRDLSAPVTAQSGRHPLPSPTAAAAAFSALGIAAGVGVVAYDEANGAFAARLWWLLRWLGHRDVAVLDGGIKAWLAAGGAIESGEAQTLVAGADGRPRFAARPDSGAVVDAAQVSEALSSASRQLIDARAPERFSGSVEPIDPVAGHIPGAINHPFAANLAADGRFLPPAQLAARWRERLAGVAPQDAIAMCGSGVTACHNLLAMEHAGLSGAKLYAGSWSEWIRDARRPVARGDV